MLANSKQIIAAFVGANMQEYFLSVHILSSLVLTVTCSYTAVTHPRLKAELLQLVTHAHAFSAKWHIAILTARDALPVHI